MSLDRETKRLKLRRLRSTESMNMQLVCTEARTAWLRRHREVHVRLPEDVTEETTQDVAHGTGSNANSSDTVRMDIARDLLYFSQGPPALQSMAAFIDALSSGQLVTAGAHHSNSPRLPQVQQVALSLGGGTTLPELCSQLARLPRLRTAVIVVPLSYGHEHGREHDVEPTAAAAANNDDDDDVLAAGSGGEGLLAMAAHLARADYEGSEDFAALIADLLAHHQGRGAEDCVPAAVRRFFEAPVRPQIKYVDQPAGRRPAVEDTWVTLKEWRERCVRQMY